MSLPFFGTQCRQKLLNIRAVNYTINSHVKAINRLTKEQNKGQTYSDCRSQK